MWIQLGKVAHNFVVALWSEWERLLFVMCERRSKEVTSLCGCRNGLLSLSGLLDWKSRMSLGL